MRRQSWVVLGTAIFFGLIAVYLVNIYLGGAQQRAETKALQTTRIAVARVPLDFGTRITPQNVRFVDWPLDSVPQGSFRDIAELSPAGRSHVVLRPILAGEPVLRSRLSGEGGRASLSALLAPNMRAAAIRISDVHGVAGFALPGDRVDVLLTRQAGEDEQVTSVLLDNVRLIAIDQDANESRERPNLGRTATLEVTQEDAQKLALGGSVGTLSLVLRAVRSTPETIAYDNPIRSSDLAGGTYSPPQLAQAGPIAAATAAVSRAATKAVRRAVSAPPPGPRVEVVRGTEPREYEVKSYAGR